jgi:hypothetical protein
MVLNIINIIAIIVIPILAVLIGQWLQNRSEKRKDKMRVFTHLMSYRAFGYVDQYSVNFFNSVPIVFYDDKDVIEKYNVYLKSLNIKQEDMEQKKKEIEDNKTKMLEAMAKSLKYKNISWDTIQNPYIPVGLLTQIEQENIYKKGQLEIAKVFTQMTDVNTSMEKVTQLGAEIEKNLRKEKK